MTEALRHRGPDDEGSFVRDGRVALGFRRLSVIDLETGNQPLFNEERTVAVTCNGEIYNFRQLRSELEDRGHRFASRTDVEVIAHLYEESGPDCLLALQGMFAIALWDERRQRLLLARDRLGVKPLYFAEVPGGLLYGSEPVAILTSGLIPAAPDLPALMQYLTLQYVPPPRTGFQSISKLAPGERLLYENGRVTIERYWTLEPDEQDGRPDEERLIARLDELLRDATRSRLESDVPLGAFLSGGIDSTLVVGFMAEAVKRVKTFSIDVPEAGYSEAAHARRAAELYGTDHTELAVEAAMVPTIAEAVRHAGEPFADSSAIPTYLVSQIARSRVTVVLSGDGGDEAFGGYRHHARALEGDRLALPGTTSHDRYAAMMSHFRPDHLERLCRPEFIAAAGGTRSAWDDVLALPAVDGLNGYLRLDTTTFLPGDILTKVDRMSMAHALEVRSPLLDYRVHEFAAGVPPALKIRDGVTKWVLRELARRRGVPEALAERPKKGFSIPLAQWFRGSLSGWLRDLLTDPATLARGYFVEAEVHRLLREHLDGSANHQKRLWNLAMLELWHRAWIDG